jgi:putative toxin-antitoxin system antitoxin component (TIGR02293 family)
MQDPSSLIDFVGGPAVIGPVPDRFALIRAVRAGLPVGAVHALVRSGRISRAESDRIVMPRKTLAHRERIGTLTADQSDRLIRVARILAFAEEIFGDADKAHRWMRRETAPLADQVPLELLDTEEGAREVESLLGRIGHGIAA